MIKKAIPIRELRPSLLEKKMIGASSLGTGILGALLGYKSGKNKQRVLENKQELEQYTKTKPIRNLVGGAMWGALEAGATGTKPYIAPIIGAGTGAGLVGLLQKKHFKSDEKLKKHINHIPISRALIGASLGLGLGAAAPARIMAALQTEKMATLLDDEPMDIDLRKITKLMGAMSKIPGLAQEATFGNEAAQKLNNGVTVLHPQKWLSETDPSKIACIKDVMDAINKIGVPIHNLNQLPKDYNGLVVKLDSNNTQIPPSGITMIDPGIYLEEPGKLQEAKMLAKYAPGTQPRTEAIGEFVKRMDINPNDPDFTNKVVDALKKDYKQFIIKPEKSWGSSVGFYKTEKSDFSGWDPKTWLSPGGEWSEIVQQREDIMKPPVHATIIDNLLRKYHKRKKDMMANPYDRNAEEYRVHALNGKVVRGGSSGRGSYYNMLFPGMGKSRQAEEFVQSVLDKLPPEHKNRMYGFDIAFRNSDGKPFIIEMNPASLNQGTSGWLSHIPILEAHLAAVQGRRALSSLAMGTVNTARRSVLGPLGALEILTRR